ncbi:MAG: HAD family phosphatase [Clostridia bacterium]|nr:HAD family phosphatase [Clostridia bacterium]
MKIQGAIFDLDGTLVNSPTIWDVLWAEYGRRYCGGKPFVPDHDDEEKIHTTPLREGLAFIGQRYGLPADADELFRVANEVFVDFYTNTLEAKPGAVELLEGLASRGVRICMASASTRDIIDLALTRCGIGKYFSRIFTCVEVGKDKRHPDIYLRAAEHLGTPKEETWVFEDAYTAVITAKRAGFHTVAIYEPVESKQREIEQITDVYVPQGERFDCVLSYFDWA